MEKVTEILSILKPYLPAIQIIIALLLILLILLQPRGEALGSAFGQNFFAVGKMRGATKKIFGLTVVLGFLFILFALLNLIA